MLYCRVDCGEACANTYDRFWIRSWGTGHWFRTQKCGTRYMATRNVIVLHCLVLHSWLASDMNIAASLPCVEQLVGQWHERCSFGCEAPDIRKVDLIYLCVTARCLHLVGKIEIPVSLYFDLIINLYSRSTLSPRLASRDGPRRSPVRSPVALWATVLTRSSTVTCRSVPPVTCMYGGCKAETTLDLGGLSPPRPKKTIEPPLSPLSIFEKKGGRRGRRNQPPPS